MSTPTDYDTVKGIQGYLKRGLSGLNELAKDRRDAYYRRRERLNDFLVNGVWRFDTCGNLGKITEVTSENYAKKHKSTRELLAIVKPGADMPAVILFKDFWGLVDGHKASMTSSHGHFLPSAKVACAECKKPWRLDNADDCVVVSETRTENGESHVGRTLVDLRAAYDARTDGDWVMRRDTMVRNDEWIDLSPVPGYDTLKRNERGWVGAHDNIDAKRDGRVTIDPDTYVVRKDDELLWHVWTYRHSECNKAWRAKSMISVVTGAFSSAGYKTIQVTPVDNRYCPCEACPPWCAVETEVGLIVIGPRKSVLNIDWSSTGEDLLELFKDEGVTKGADHIHAWGWEKVTDYLGRIRVALSGSRV